MGVFLLPWQPNQEADWQIFSYMYFQLPLPIKNLYQIRVLLLQWFWFLKFMLPWQPNKIATGHETYKLSRQSSNDHNCQIWFTSLRWL